MRIRSVKAGRVIASLAALGLLVGSCSAGSDSQPIESAPAESVPFNGCDSVACTGTLAGAPYEVKLPQRWNGTLLVYSHGYRLPNEPIGKPASAPGRRTGDKEVETALLEQGYALAGSAYRRNGWAVSDGVAAAEDLYQFFADKVGKPQRVYAWGDSLGGLITEVLSEKHPKWLSAAAPMCGVLAGIVPNMNLALDVAYAVKTLIYPKLKLTGFKSAAEAQKQFTSAVGAVAQTGFGPDASKIAYIGAIVDAPTKTRNEDGRNNESKLFAMGEGLISALSFATISRFEIEQRYGGNISGNEQTDYSKRISFEDGFFVDSLNRGAIGRYDRAMAKKGKRVTANKAAVRRAATAGGDPAARIRIPTITLHTVADPIVIVQNEAFFKNRYRFAAGKGGLMQLFTVPPERYEADPGAPYGAGHCNFTNASRIGLIKVLDGWVRTGNEPGVSEITEALGEDSGYNPGWQPPPWPTQQ